MEFERIHVVMRDEYAHGIAGNANVVDCQEQYASELAGVLDAEQLG